MWLLLSIAICALLAPKAWAIDKALIEAALKAPYNTKIQSACPAVEEAQTRGVAYGEAGNGLTVVSQKQAKELFEMLTRRTDIPYGYADDGCYVRAHQAAKVLESSGIISGKILFEGKGKFAANSPTHPGKKIVWDSGFHVVPFVLVKNANGKIEPMVLDPTFFHEPVSMPDVLESITESRLVDNNPEIKNIYFRNRFTYSDPEEGASSWMDGLQDFRASALVEFQQRAAVEKKARGAK